VQAMQYTWRKKMPDRYIRLHEKHYIRSSPAIDSIVDGKQFIRK
jgi:hypothetical protein